MGTVLCVHIHMCFCLGLGLGEVAVQGKLLEKKYSRKKDDDLEGVTTTPGLQGCESSFHVFSNVCEEIFTSTAPLRACWRLWLLTLLRIPQRLIPRSNTGGR